MTRNKLAPRSTPTEPAASPSLTEQTNYYDNLPTPTIEQGLRLKSPTIAQIQLSQPESGLVTAHLRIVVAINELVQFFNVGKTMDASQLNFTAALIIERFPHFRFEEIKACFRRAMFREQLFDRLDGNIILRWLSQYDMERTQAAMDLSAQLDAERVQAASLPAPDAISFEQYMATLHEAADGGDAQAAEQLAFIDKLSSNTTRKTKKAQFFKWFHTQWLPSQNKKA